MPTGCQNCFLNGINDEGVCQIEKSRPRCLLVLKSGSRRSFLPNITAFQAEDAPSSCPRNTRSKPTSHSSIFSSPPLYLRPLFLTLFGDSLSLFAQDRRSISCMEEDFFSTLLLANAQERSEYLLLRIVNPSIRTFRLRHLIHSGFPVTCPLSSIEMYWTFRTFAGSSHNTMLSCAERTFLYHGTYA